jgi:hypothetical protein
MMNEIEQVYNQFSKKEQHAATLETKLKEQQA